VQAVAINKLFEVFCEMIAGPIALDSLLGAHTQVQIKAPRRSKIGGEGEIVRGFAATSNPATPRGRTHGGVATTPVFKSNDSHANITYSQ
jgi:hypothetical protein